MNPEYLPGRKYLAGYKEDKSKWYLKFTNIKELSLLPKPTAISMVVPFKGGRIVVVETKRGWGLPSGHFEEEDESWQAGGKRELLEEACIRASVSSFTLCGAMITNYYTEPTSILIALVKDIVVLRFEKKFEVLRRKFMKPNEVIKLFYGNKKIIKGILTIAGSF